MIKLGKEHHELMSLAKDLKYQSNRNKIELGIVLLRLQALHDKLEGIEEFGTFNSNLAELHLSLPRCLLMLKNAKYVLEYNISPTDYHYYDSSVLDLLRVNKKDPRKYLDDIKGGVSYTDLTKIISP